MDDLCDIIAYVFGIIIANVGESPCIISDAVAGIGTVFCYIGFSDGAMTGSGERIYIR